MVCTSFGGWEKGKTRTSSRYILEQKDCKCFSSSSLKGLAKAPEHLTSSQHYISPSEQGGRGKSREGEVPLAAVASQEDALPVFVEVEGDVGEL